MRDSHIPVASGIGCWGLGGPIWRDGRSAGWPRVDDDTAMRTLRAALDAGVTYVDTADVYGCGRSERLVGRALRHRRHEIVLATKFGRTFEDGGDRITGRITDPALVPRAAAASLRRLGVETIDIYLLHLPRFPAERLADLAGELAALQAAGHIRGYGWSTDDAVAATAFADLGATAMEFALNVFHRNVAMMALVRQRSLTGLVRSPLATGLLTGDINHDTRWDANDVRAGEIDLAGRDGARLDALAELREVLTCGGRTLAQGTLAWLWSQDAGLVPIPGARTPAHAVENAAAMRAPRLPAAAVRRAEALLRSRQLLPTEQRA